MIAQKAATWQDGNTDWSTQEVVRSKQSEDDNVKHRMSQDAQRKRSEEERFEWFPLFADRSTGLNSAHQRLAFAKAMLESRAPTHELYRAPAAMAPEPEDGIYEEDENQVRWSALATCEWRPPEYRNDASM